VLPFQGRSIVSDRVMHQDYTENHADSCQGLVKCGRNPIEYSNQGNALQKPPKQD